MDLNEKTTTPIVDSPQILSEYPDVLMPEDVMKILHIGRNSVYKYLKDGTIRSITIAGKYRIPKYYLKQYLYADFKEAEVY